jgi:TM2 domain
MKRNLVILSLGICLFASGSHAAPFNETEATNIPSPVSGSLSVAFECKSDADCTYHGRCDIPSGNCVCNSGYTEVDCSYKEKKQIAAFLLHLFLGFGFGAGHFYAGNDGVGAGELVLFWGSIFTFAAGWVSRSSVGNVAAAIGIAGFIGSIAWWIAETARFGQNEIKDGNGKSLKEW